MDKFNQIISEANEIYETTPYKYTHAVAVLASLGIDISLNVGDGIRKSMYPILVNMLKEFVYIEDTDLKEYIHPNNTALKQTLFNNFTEGGISEQDKGLLIKFITNREYSTYSEYYKFAYYFLIRIGNRAYLKPQDS